MRVVLRHGAHCIKCRLILPVQQKFFSLAVLCLGGIDDDDRRWQTEETTRLHGKTCLRIVPYDQSIERVRNGFSANAVAGRR